MNLTTASPREIDTELAALHAKLDTIVASRDKALDRLHRALGEKPRHIGRTRKDWPTTAPQAIEKARALAATAEPKKPWDHDYLPDALAAYDTAEAARTAVLDQMTPYNEVYRARRWNRFFLVTSSDGHIHSGMNCSTTRPTTTFGWLPDLSGKTEADAVAEHGPLLCTVCWPSAPLDWTRGKAKPAACTGSGFMPKAGTERRTGMNWYGACTGCDQTQTLTTSGAVRKHKPPKTQEPAVTEPAAEPDHTAGLPVDGRGLPYKGEGRDAYYVTKCCGVAVTISEDVLCCKKCYEEADDFRLGMTPTVAETDKSRAFNAAMVAKALGQPATAAPEIPGKRTGVQVFHRGVAIAAKHADEAPHALADQGNPTEPVVAWADSTGTWIQYGDRVQYTDAQDPTDTGIIVADTEGGAPFLVMDDADGSEHEVPADELTVLKRAKYVAREHDDWLTGTPNPPLPTD